MYPGDMTDEQWEIVQKHFPAGKRAGRPRVRSAWGVLSCSFQQSVWPALATARRSYRLGTWGILLFIWDLRAGSKDVSRLDDEARTGFDGAATGRRQ